MSRLPHIGQHIGQGLGGAALESSQQGQDVAVDREQDRALSISREEDRLLTYGNLFASAFFGARGELRDKRGA